MIKQGLTQGIFFFAAPLVTGSVLAVSPSFAATFSFSEARVNLSNFSHNPVNVYTFTSTNTVTQASSGQVTAKANADSAFLGNPAQAENSSLSSVSGQGRNYSGLAQSVAGLIGYDFIVEKDETFSFNFTAFLNLQASIENPPSERANAFGNISFLLYDSNNPNNPLDFFTLSSSLATLGEDDFLTLENSESITLSTEDNNVNFGGLEELAQSSVNGVYSRTFSSLTRLTLVEAKENRVSVAVPESSNLLSLFLFSLICLSYGVKKKGLNRG